MAEQPAKLRVANDLLTRFKRVDPVRPGAGQRSIVDAQVRPPSVVIVNVRSDKKAEMPLTEDNEVVETLVLDRLDPAFNERVLVGRMGRGRNHAGASILQGRVEPSDVLPVPVTNDVVDSHSFAAVMFKKRLRLALHPFGIGFETGGGHVNSASTQVDEGQYKTLSQSLGRPDAFAEEVDLPEGLGVHLQELVPGPLPAPGSGMHAGLLEDVLDCAPGNGMNPQLPELTEDAAVAPASLLGNANHDLPNRFKRFGSAHPLGLLAQSLLLDPALVSSRMDEDDRFVGVGSKFRSELEQSFFLLLLEKDPLLGDQCTSDDKLLLEQLILPPQFILCTSCQIEEKRRKPTCHEQSLSVTDASEMMGDKLSAPLNLSLIGTLPRSGAIRHQPESIAANR
jgi:hypothetical protein